MWTVHAMSWGWFSSHAELVCHDILREGVNMACHVMRLVQLSCRSRLWWHPERRCEQGMLCHEAGSALMQIMPVMTSIILRESVNSTCHNIRLVQFTWRYCLGVIQAFMLVLCWVKGSIPSVLHKYMHNLMSLANKCPCIPVCSGWNLHVL